MRPVDQPAQLVPLVHTAKLDPVADSDRHTPGKVNVVGNQQGVATAQLQDKSLVMGAIAVVRQQANNET